MALIATQPVTITGTAPTYGAAAASATIKYTGGNSFLIVRNASGAPSVVTVVVPGSKHGQANPDVAVTVPATTGERWIGPFTNDMADEDNLITVTISPITTVTVALVQV